MAMAPATPAMLPVPTVAAKAVHTAWKGETPPVSGFSAACARWYREKPSFRTWKNRVRRLKIQPHSQNQQEGWRAPHHPVEGLDEGGYGVCHMRFPFHSSSLLHV